MKKRYAYWLKNFLYLSAFVAFTVVLLPLIVLCITGLFNNGSGAPFLPHIEKEAIPSSINVYRTASGAVETIAFEDYVMGVVAGEMPASFEIEALKAQAVAARTYSLSKILRSGDNGFPAVHPVVPICDDVHCQVYRSPSELEKLKSKEWMDSGWSKIQEAVLATKGELMYYDGSLAEQALFHSSSGGTTENSEDVFVSAVPYLRSVESPYESDATHKDEQTCISLPNLISQLSKSFPDKDFHSVTAENIVIKSRSQGGRVEELQLGSTSLSGSEIRSTLNLASANFTVETVASGSDYLICFTTKGYGHGVGMSQYGANGMAKAGYNYKDILSHYYSGVSIY